jgi:hypothetical protein
MRQALSLPLRSKVELDSNFDLSLKNGER